MPFSYIDVVKIASSEMSDELDQYQISPGDMVDLVGMLVGHIAKSSAAPQKVAHAAELLAHTLDD